MADQEQSKMSDSERVLQAIRESWCAETCGDPVNWSSDNPSWQQCDASAFIAWEHLGGDLVLGKVYLDDEETEHHYWNRIDRHDVDLTRGQFIDGQEVREIEVLPNSFLRENASLMKPEVLERIAIMRERVSEKLDV